MKSEQSLLVTLITLFVLAPSVVFAGDCGDVDNSGGVDIDDFVYLITYIFADGPAPDCGVSPAAIGTVTDIDGNVYLTAKFGDQWWMMENLKVTHYRNGDPIPNVTDNATWAGLSTGAYCDYDNDQSNVEPYGRLYNWYAVDDTRNIAPEGWHVPSDDEWKQLEVYLGMSQAEADGTGWRGTDEGDKLKQAGTTHWGPPCYGGTNESGFTALPGGYRIKDGSFHDMGGWAYLWCSTGSSGSSAWSRHLFCYYSKVNRDDYVMQIGYSVRCVRD